MRKVVIATRSLEYIKKGEGVKKKLMVRVFAPYEIQEGQVSFPFSPGTAGCAVEFEGLETEHFNTVTYGADLLQALQLAADVEPILKRMSKTYDLYFPTGGPYFE